MWFVPMTFRSHRRMSLTFRMAAGGLSMRKTVVVTATVLGLSLAYSHLPVAAQSDSAGKAKGAVPALPSVFVGPQVRDGFADVDAGIRDSIQDIQQELKLAGFPAAGAPGDGVLGVMVLGRGIVTNGSIGFGSSSTTNGTGYGFGYVVPNTVPTVTAVLRVRGYERRMQSEGATWGRAARQVVQDVTAWWDANQKAVQAAK